MEEDEVQTMQHGGEVDLVGSLQCPEENEVERTIRLMQEVQVCLHPKHWHSFQQVHFMLFRKCIGCQQRLPLYAGVSVVETSSVNAVVRCVACGAVAHRSCAQQDENLPVCPVNQARLQCEEEEEEEEVDNEEETVTFQNSASFDADAAAAAVVVDVESNKGSSSSSREATTTEEASTLKHWSRVKRTPIPTISLPESRDFSSLDEHHHNSKDKHSNNLEEDEGHDDNEGEQEQVHVTPLHYANHPFASISRALQENILAVHLRHLQEEGDNESPSAASATTTAATTSSSRCLTQEQQQREETAETTTGGDSQQQLLQQQSTPSYLLPHIPIVKFAASTLELVKSTVANASSSVAAAAASSSTSSALPSSSSPGRGSSSTIVTAVTAGSAAAAVVVAGGAIAGGVAGLVLAGPAGAYAGTFGGASALGVILEGGVSIGVFVGSVAMGGLTAAKQVEQATQRRVLTMGEAGTARKVLLVRPQIEIDPVWESIWCEARRCAPDSHDFPLFRDATARERYRHDSDIILTDEDEIPTKDKVLLLVSRTLSDKASMPGFVYRYMIDAFLDRCRQRNHVLETTYTATSSTSQQQMTPSEMSPRIRRDDVHAVIRYVTATLLEGRPGFGSSLALTELTATSVECLVFGRLYDMVFEEIVCETEASDAALQAKIQAFEEKSYTAATTLDQRSLVSEGALEAIRTLPEAHSAVDKLFFCVQFLERLSDFYLDSRDSGSNHTLCADSLLKLTCQHIIAARIPNMNAEVGFLEEFARDEQLLRGREGYSLVTLQASLHFLNMSDDLECDIFAQDDNEENVPVSSVSSSASSSASSVESIKDGVIINSAWD